MNLKNSWIKFYRGWVFNISFESCGYFDNRPRVNFGLIFFMLTFVIPFRNKWTDECIPPKWGIAIHSKSIWIYKGGKGNMEGGNNCWAFEIPFITKKWVRTSILLNGPSELWEHETKGNRKDFYKKEWKERQKYWQYNYTDSHDGEVIPTTIYLEEMEWRPKWLMWTMVFSKTRKYIDVNFSKEVGSRKGSWKGGTLGCGYELLPGETPIDCIKRMEADRKF